MAQRTALFMVALLAFACVALADKDNKEDKKDDEKKNDKPENCVLRVEGGDITDDKSCFGCAFGCLVTAECKGMEWAGSPFVPQHHLANFSCPDAPTGDDGEKLCVIMAEEDDEWRIIDASPKNCVDCVDACEGERDCDRMAWDYTLQDKKFLSSFKCPKYSPRPRSPSRAPSPANMTDEWLNSVKKYSPMPTPSPAYTSPAPPKPCQLFNAKAERYDNSNKDCYECQEQCMGDQECAYAILNGTLTEAGFSVNRTNLAGYKCPGWTYAGNASAEYRCTVISDTSKLMEAGDQNCTSCVQTCQRWAECATLYINHEVFPRAMLPEDGTCPFTQVLDPEIANEVQSEEGSSTEEEESEPEGEEAEETDMPIAGRRRLLGTLLQ